MAVSTMSSASVTTGLVLLTRAIAAAPTTCTSTPITPSIRRTTTIERSVVQSVVSKNSFNSEFWEALLAGLPEYSVAGNLLAIKSKVLENIPYLCVLWQSKRNGNIGKAEIRRS